MANILPLEIKGLGTTMVKHADVSTRKTGDRKPVVSLHFRWDGSENVERGGCPMLSLVAAMTPMEALKLAQNLTAAAFAQMDEA